MDPVPCNKCGQNCIKQMGPGIDDNYGTRIVVHGGYASIPEIGDLMRYEFWLCEFCILDLMTTLKIPPLESMEPF